jgi:hypothetical protein
VSGLRVSALALLISASIALTGCDRHAPSAPRPAEQRPTLLLLTSLPLIFGEKFGLGEGGSAALTRLETRYRVQPISVTDAASLRGARLLLAAHPNAQPAEDLVELDKWVRGGGRLLLLADPMLEWHSERPLGDRLRPSPSFADTGLLAHWGMRLDAPDDRGPVERTVEGRRILVASPGRLIGKCPTEADGLVARCAIGRGKVTIIADADFLDERGVEGATTADNLDWLSAELANLESR